MWPTRLLLGLSALSLLSAACSACGETRAEGTAPIASGKPAAVTVDGAIVDGGAASAEISDAAVPYEGPYLYALFMMTPVMS